MSSLFAKALILCTLAVSHVQAKVQSAPTLPRSSRGQCPNKPAGRLEDGQKTNPLPGLLGIIPDIESDSVLPWTFPPKCPGLQTDNSTGSKLHCIFTSAEFRNGHGLSLITSTTTASNLVGLDAFDDRPTPQAAERRAAWGPAYEVVEIGGKGKGLVASRTIRRGEIILVDFPAILIATSFLADTKPHHRRRLIKQAISQLPEETRRRFYALSRGPEKYEVDAIVGVNSNSVMLGDNDLHVGVFTEAARINHGCQPNAAYRFSQRRLTMEIVAYHTIEAGEEITMSYVPITTPASERRKHLQENWGFACQCSLCHADELALGESENNRRRMTELRDSILDARKNGYFQDAINIAGDWLQFSEWERVPPLLPEYHETLAELYFLNGDLVNATRYGRMSLDGWVKFGSVDDDSLERARGFLRFLTSRTEKAT
ncbi:hypothetical protein B0T19DRAFT_239487 [Cercophora scortea]|uniref:SET domain-containing protein n=1 Tax=Cercophora scortea TaxID=314031 RepID=A0AAE0IGY3_9PEZI|nr:hypothetical protein B0T19DRAFT_239487 [Cercophora scortea]